jgi:hypothetical protein
MFGSVAGLFVSMLIFAASLGLGSNGLVQLFIQLIGFFVAGFVAGRFALVDPTLSGGMAALILFFGVTVVTVGSAGVTIVGIVVLGTVAAFIGTAAGSLGHARRKD